MIVIYTFIAPIVEQFIGLLSKVNSKLHLLVTGQRQAWNTLRQIDAKGRKIVWVHVASLGEYQQAVPVLRSLREHPSNPFILVSFFSPSGYEVVQSKVVGDAACYLPLDTAANARRFVSELNPTIALFVKYEIWPNYLKALSKQQVKHFLIAARFYSGQRLFRYRFGRKLLASFEVILCQDENSMTLAKRLMPSANVLHSGDTRFDQVISLANNREPLAAIEAFKNGRFCLVVGSSWPEEEALIGQYLSAHIDDQFCVIFAPHHPSTKGIEQLKKTILEPIALYSQLSTKEAYRVLVIDSIGLLNQVYKSADLAFVGGGFRSGLHNTLEPAALGIPVLIGPQYHNFPEVNALVDHGGVLPINDQDELSSALANYIKQPELKRAVGQSNLNFVENHGGATQKVMEVIGDYLA